MALSSHTMALSEETRKRMELVKTVCNDSPFYKHLGMKVVDFDEGMATLEMPYKPELANLYATAHGGSIAAIADSACGVALGTTLEPGETTVTIDLRVNYIAPFKEGTLVARGEVINKGRTSCIEQCRLTQGDKLVAIAQVVHFIRQMKT